MPVYPIISSFGVLAVTLALGTFSSSTAAPAPVEPRAPPAPAAATAEHSVPVVDGIVQPRQPLPAAIADAMAFPEERPTATTCRARSTWRRRPRKLAGYFTSAHVNDDGSRSNRKLASRAAARLLHLHVPALPQVLRRSRVARPRSRPGRLEPRRIRRPPTRPGRTCPGRSGPTATRGGSQDKDSLEPDKAALFGTAYLALFDATKRAEVPRRREADRGHARPRIRARTGAGRSASFPQDGRVFQAVRRRAGLLRRVLRSDL